MTNILKRVTKVALRAHISVEFPFCLLYIEDMVRKISITFIIFLFLSLLNLFLIEKAFAYSNIRKDFAQVLGEISDRKNNGQNYQFTASYKADLSEGYSAEIKPGDARSANLKAFLRKYNSDLYNHAEKIIEVSDKYGFDYRLLPAIACRNQIYVVLFLITLITVGGGEYMEL